MDPAPRAGTTMEQTSPVSVRGRWRQLTWSRHYCGGCPSILRRRTMQGVPVHPRHTQRSELISVIETRPGQDRGMLIPMQAQRAFRKDILNPVRQRWQRAGTVEMVRPRDWTILPVESTCRPCFSTQWIGGVSAARCRRRSKTGWTEPGGRPNSVIRHD